jgi:hypothetical protein
LPARKLLETASADPATVRLLCAAYDRAVKELRDSGQPEIVNEIIAQKILQLCEQGERDFDRLVSGALSGLQKVRPH